MLLRRSDPLGQRGAWAVAGADVGSLAGRFIEWWRRLTPGRSRRVKAIVVRRRTDLPQTLSRTAIYIVGDPSKWLVMECPCGTGHRLTVNLATHAQPTWAVTDAPSGISVYPSLDVVGKSRRCHFLIRHGHVQWW